MNHKRKRPKKQRAGCLYCKPHKGNGVGTHARAKPSDRKRLEATDHQFGRRMRRGTKA